MRSTCPTVSHGTGRFRIVLDVLRSDRIEPLADELVGLLSVTADDPFAREWVAVASIGMRRWLSQRLSASLGTAIGADGVCANVEMPFPDELRRVVLAADLLSGGSAPVTADPWEPERLVWPVLELLAGPVVDTVTELAPLRSPPAGVSLVGRARSIADLFDRYCRHRPDMVRAWADGRPVDGAGAAIAGERAWQPALFHLLSERIGVPSPPERLAAALGRVADGGVALDLPERLTLFGMSTVPTDLVELLVAVGHHRSVTLMLLAPSQVAADAVAGHARDTGARTVPSRREDRSDGVIHNPLHRSWGTVGRESTVVLAAGGVTARSVAVAGGAVPEPSTLLGRVQADIRADREPDRSYVIGPQDRSVQVHACTGLTRQVEVLRDAVLHLLAEDPTLTEGDVAVLCPRIELFAPVIEAVLGPSADSSAQQDGVRGERSADEARAPLLRYRITDRRVRADIPLLGVLGALLDVIPGRFTASDVADLLAMGPVRNRFGLDADDLDQLGEWIAGSSVRWGLDGPHRASWHMPADHRDNTWAAGLDQMMAGTVVRGDDLTLVTGGVAPLAVSEGSVRAATRVAEAVRTLGAIRGDVVDGSHSVERWCELLAAAVDRMCSLPWSESWQRRRLDRVLSELRDRSAGADGEASDLSLSLADVRALLVDLLGGEPSRAAFGTGAITFCSLSPLRSVPARVVCVLGLDQDALPGAPSKGDDLLLASPKVGDRDLRSDVRQQLLEAVLAAQDSLVITYGAVDVRTNLPVPPAVVLDEWWDLLAATCVGDASAVRRRLCVDHPRQGFDPRNFAASGIGDPGGPTSHVPWSFDPVACRSAVAFRDREPDPAPDVLVASPLDPAPPQDVLELDRLRWSAVGPVREFMTRRLGVVYRRAEESGSDTLPAELDPLERHWLGADLLAARTAGLDAERWLEVAGARGSLPPGRLRDTDVSLVSTAVDRIERSATELGVGLAHPEHHAIDLVVGHQRIVGVVERCVGGDRPGPVRLHYSKSKPAQRIHAAIDLLALVASDPSPEWRAVVIRRIDAERKGDRADELVLVPVGASADERRELAVRALDGLLRWREQAMRQPLPIFERTSHHLALGATNKARDAWKGWSDHLGECGDQHVRAAFGDLDFDEMRALRVDGRSPTEHAVELWGLLDLAVKEEER